MQLYLINLDRRPDRLAAMTARAGALGLALTRIPAVDAATTPAAGLDALFAASGPLGVLPRGDKACFLSHRRAWQALMESGAAHAVILEDDVRLSGTGRPFLASDDWVPPGAGLIKLEHYGPRGQRVLLTDFRPVDTRMGTNFRLGRILSRHTGAAAYVIARQTAQNLLAQTRFALPVDHLMFNPNNSPLFAGLAPLQLLPAIARQQEFVGEKSDIEGTRKPLRALSPGYARRELVRFGYDLRLVPRQLAALARGARFMAMKTAD